VVGVGEAGAVGIAIAVELGFEEEAVGVCMFDFWDEGKEIQRGRSIFSMRLSSMLGASVMSPMRFLRILEGGMV
jgi:hypothetical protein